MAVPSYKTDFIATAVEASALKFGTFTLKSGRVSPYFFNAGLFHTAKLVRSLSSAYAQTLVATEWNFDILFGPAYKGIPLAAVTVDKLAQIDEKKWGKTAYSFNRKEAKNHGEGGSIVGASLKGKRVVIIDDVITAGTAIREAIDIIKTEGGELVGIIVAFDRQEKTPSARELEAKKSGGSVEDAWDAGPRPSAIGEVTKSYGVPVQAILTLDDVVESLRATGDKKDLERLGEYQRKYRASD